MGQHEFRSRSGYYRIVEINAANPHPRDIAVGAVCHGVLLLARSIDSSPGR